MHALMTMLRSTSAKLLWGLMLVLAGPATAATVSYTAVGLGFNTPRAISGAGDIVGYSGNNQFLLSGGVQTSLPLDSVSGISGNGLIAGVIAFPCCSFGFRGWHPILRAGGVNVDLGVPQGAWQAYANDVNNSGWVVGDRAPGTAPIAGQQLLATLWAGGAAISLGDLGGGNSRAFGINNAGRIVGYSSLPGGTVAHAYYWEGGVMHDIGTLGAGGSSLALDINEAGQIAGYSNTCGDSRLPCSANQAFRWTNGVFEQLVNLPGSTSGAASALNDQGQVVGSSGGHGALWSDGSVYDLTDFLSPQERLDGWMVTGAEDINDDGVIVGQGFNPRTQQLRAYMFVPEAVQPPPGGSVPEPATLALALAGFLGAARAARRR